MTTSDDLISQNLPKIKVENESLHKELQEKHELLCQASKAMELMENHHKKQCSDAQMVTDDLNHKIEAMNVSIDDSLRYMVDKHLTFDIFIIA